MLLNEKAECVPELTGAGENDVHRARVTVDKTVLSCGIALGQLEAICTDKVMVWMGSTEKAEPAPTKPDKPVAKRKPEPPKRRPQWTPIP